MSVKNQQEVKRPPWIKDKEMRSHVDRHWGGPVGATWCVVDAVTRRPQGQAVRRQPASGSAMIDKMTTGT